jgi:phospholipase C
MSDALTRRQLLRTAGAAGAAATLGGSMFEPWLQDALAAPRRAGSLKDIEHVVILIQENRSFDHYFGSYKGVKGFADARNRASFTQPGYPSTPDHSLQPFHLDANMPAQDCTPDITHDWGPMHGCWNGGKNDGFVTEHQKANGDAGAALTMGYYSRADLPLYYALADAFTICDHYHCSVIGPTDPNRLMAMSGSLDPAGKHGGPLVETLVSTRNAMAGKFTWTTMPEQLEARHISWKSYTDPRGGILDSVLPYFAKYQSGKYKAKGITPTYPAEFLADVKHNRLPSVSWLHTSIRASEHPAFSGAKAGEVEAHRVVSALTKNKKLWAKTALFLTYDENGGFFDHIPPPTPPAGTPGEYLTVSPLPAAASGNPGPIGLGFRVPMIVISPFTRGGFVSSETFDHTSMLRFLERRFGAEVPNLSTWRRKTTGDMTSAFNFAKPSTKVPALPAVTLSAADQNNGDCPSGAPGPYPVPTANSGIPAQEKGKPRRPSGIVKSSH